uniref:Uncharacterized protein n=1 Tax=Paramoeba aestuarina TaxID=180227 RepID=A0A7S4LAF2_9EUKA|mmetsp:Transcript_33720/g.52735  ORF Transcript_33720/g.52735 Transcript_33720/m.52735 type:complete len:222 (+) Transcript_33720:46-711(+)
MIFVYFFATAELLPHAIPETEWRDSLMRLFFLGISHEGMDDFGTDLLRRDFCDGWLGITCFQQVVRIIKYDRSNYGNFRIGALPNTVWIVEINRCAQQTTIVTRLFPISLKKVDLSFNQYARRIDLTAFPPHLEEAYFQENQLYGPLFLGNLPSVLRVLDLSSNKFILNTVYYENIPPSVKRIALSQTYGHFRVDSVRAIHINNKVCDKSIFVGMKRSNVH